jgi:isopentenyl-diphosphate delta-isomerase
MGFDCNLDEVFSTIYKTDVGGGLTEHEYLHVFFGIYNGEPKLNPEEAVDWKWIDVNELAADMKNNNNKYSEWLKIIFRGKLYEAAKNFVKNKE